MDSREHAPQTPPGRECPAAIFGQTEPRTGKVEADDATCQNGVMYELTFDPNCNMATKKLD